MQRKNVRKVFYRRQKQAQNISRQAEENIDKLLLGRFSHLVAVRRFVSGWVVLWLLLALITVYQVENLSSYYQTVKAVPGGIYNEGVLGTMTNVNPIYATNLVDTSISRLIFAGLFTYNSQNQLVGCLASSYRVDNTGTLYTVKLKPHLTWQDGKPLTASDVVFTFDTIQNANAQSPYYSSWQGITVSSPNPTTIQFKLPNPLASFPYNLTMGIIPKHILATYAVSDLRSANFNTTKPIGAGPFSWEALQVNGNTPQNANERVALVPFNHYVLGKPKLNEFIINAYANKGQLINAFSSGQLVAVAGLNRVPSQLKNDHSLHVQSRILTAGDYVFFRTNDGALSDTTVRKALVLASNPNAIISKLGYQTFPVNEPLLVGQLGYNPKYAQVTGQLAQAQKLLAQDGWTKGKNGMMVKGNQQLSFNLVTTNTSENRLVARTLVSQWKLLGVDVTPVFESANTYTTTLQNHNYDMTLNGISIGIDPDVFVYWDKSQYDPRSSNLNFSDWNNNKASLALEAGRTRLNPALRIIKYQPFLAAWQSDAPALGLFQPRFLYITSQTIYGMGDHEINSPAGRFNDVQNWEISTAAVTDKKVKS